MELEYDNSSDKTLPSHGRDRSPILRGPILKNLYFYTKIMMVNEHIHNFI